MGSQTTNSYKLGLRRYLGYRGEQIKEVQLDFRVKIFLRSQRDGSEDEDAAKPGDLCLMPRCTL